MQPACFGLFHNLFCRYFACIKILSTCNKNEISIYYCIQSCNYIYYNILRDYLVAQMVFNHLLLLFNKMDVLDKFAVD